MIFKEVNKNILFNDFYTNSVINEIAVCYQTVLRLQKSDLLLYYHKNDNVFILFDGAKMYLIDYFEVVFNRLITEYNDGHGTNFTFTEVKKNIKESYDSNISMDLLLDVINLLNYFYNFFTQVKEIESMYEKSDKDFQTFLSLYKDNIFIYINFSSLQFNYVDSSVWSIDVLKYILKNYMFRNYSFKIDWELIQWTEQN